MPEAMQSRPECAASESRASEPVSRPAASLSADHAERSKQRRDRSGALLAMGLDCGRLYGDAHSYMLGSGLYGELPISLHGQGCACGAAVEGVGSELTEHPQSAGGSSLLTSSATFQLPSACFFQSVM